MWCNLSTLQRKTRFFQFIKTNISSLCLQSETKFFSPVILEML